MPLTLDEIVTLAPEAVRLLRDIRKQLNESCQEFGPLVSEVRQRIISVRDPDSDGGRRITRGELKMLLEDLRYIGLHAISLITSNYDNNEDDDYRKLARRCYKFAFAVIIEVKD